MFTGIIQAVGTVVSREARGGDARLVIDAAALAAKVDAVRLAVGESVAINGTCLTVLDPHEGRLAFDVSAETLGKTTLGSLAPGSRVNLEAALRMGDPLGGHLVSGHVDGLATVVATSTEARSLRVVLEAPAALARYVASKGSVALDGVSLTVNEVDGRRFGVNLIPHTIEQTTFGTLAPGVLLNLEIDPIARYVERLSTVQR
ncbi:riboflavin synthase [bacterium]|nr:MAG: riboflavin synthase [bacterium]